MVLIRILSIRVSTINWNSASPVPPALGEEHPLVAEKEPSTADIHYNKNTSSQKPENIEQELERIPVYPSCSAGDEQRSGQKTWPAQRHTVNARVSVDSAENMHIGQAS